MILNFYLIFSIIFIIVFTYEYDQRALFPNVPYIAYEASPNYEMECQLAFNATEEDIKVLTLNEQMPKYKIHYCLLGCYYRKNGMFDQNNYLNFDKAIEDINDLQMYYKDLYQKLINIIKDCILITSPSTDECIAAEQYFTCLIIGTAKLKYKL